MANEQPARVSVSLDYRGGSANAASVIIFGDKESSGTTN
jgi:hypothetical protein